MEIKDGVVFKQGEPEVLRMEALKTRLARAIGKRTGLFSVPRLVGLDLRRKTIATEFVPRLKNLRETALENRLACCEAFRSAGRALATVHCELRLPADQLRPLPDYLLSNRDDHVALHGDFFWGNVCYQPEKNQIVLLDWASAPLLGGVVNFGPRYFDLLWFSWNLFFWLPPRRILTWNPERLVRELIGGYRQVEDRFQWQEYVQYRSAMRPLVMRYWKGKRKAVGSTPLHSCAELLGWLRWRAFPGAWFGTWSG